MASIELGGYEVQVCSGPTRNDKDRTGWELHKVGVAVDRPAFLHMNACLCHVYNTDNQVNHKRTAWMMNADHVMHACLPSTT